MKLYVLARTDKVGYDEAYQFVIAADDEAEARAIAADYRGDEGPEVWLTTANCVWFGLTLETPENSVVCRAFREG